MVHAALTKPVFPPRWKHDVLRGLAWFAACDAPRDERLLDPIALLRSKRRKDGTWTRGPQYSGRVFFELESGGKPSRINTLRALRVLRWWERQP